ncbi:MAG: YitT family protein, partial [Erysipelotrichaceae bacterium]|nr:YitT family protein [Erysipelotrichaceae bacterium]
MNRKTVRSIVLAASGALIMGVGIGMSSKIGIGVDAFTSVQNALSRITGLSLGTITALGNAILAVIGFVLCKKNVGLATILFIFISKWPVDFGY